MLTGLLTSIKDQLSKSYLIAGLFPTVLFLAGNGAMAYRYSPTFRLWVQSVDALEDKTAMYAALVAAILLAGYLFSTLNGVLLEALEGRRAPIRWLAIPLHYGQWARLRDIDDRYHAAVMQLADVTDVYEWIVERKYFDVIRQVAARAPGHHAAGASRSTGYQEAYAQVRRLRRRQQGHRLAWAHELNECVGALEAAIRNNPGLVDSPTDAEDMLTEIIKYARDRWQLERITRHKQRQFNFPGTLKPSDERSTDSLLAPTTIGNIGRTMRSYAQTRYQMDLDLFWTRLHNCLLRAAPDYFAALQDAKIQVDALVAFVWCTAASTVLWSILLVFAYPSRRGFLAVTICGPIAVRVFYGVACSSYRVFADLMRSSVDLFRFTLLGHLHVPLPYGIDEERSTWVTLGNFVGYAEEQSLRYSHHDGQ